jgi:hypothetical protein
LRRSAGWKFIILFFLFLFGWIGINSIAFFRAFDRFRSSFSTFSSPASPRSGADHHDEPESTGGEGPLTRRARLQVNLKAELESGTGEKSTGSSRTSGGDSSGSTDQLDLMKDVWKQHARRERRAPRTSRPWPTRLRPGPMEK